MDTEDGYWLEVYDTEGRVYRDGELIGWYREDPLSNGFAAFKASSPKPIARPKTERTCIRKITDGEWDGED